MKIRENTEYIILSSEKHHALGIENESTANGALVKLQIPTETESQRWIPVALADGWFRLLNKKSGKALDLCMAGVENGTWIHQWDSLDDADSQAWRMAEGPDGTTTIESKKAGRCIDICLAIDTDGAQLQIWDATGQPPQNWIFEEAVKKVSKRSSAVKTGTKASKTTAGSKAKKPAAKRASAKSSDTSPTKAAAKKAAATKAKISDEAIQ